MMDEPPAVREIHEIRERLYEQQKDWSDQQLIDHYNRVADEWASDLGLKKASRDANPVSLQPDDDEGNGAAV